MAETTRGAALRRAIETCIRPDDDAIAKLGDVFTDDVTVWSPNLLASGLADLAENLRFRERRILRRRHPDRCPRRLREQGARRVPRLGHLLRSLRVDEQVVIEPNGHQLLLGAAAVADFDGDKIKALRAYFDDATLLEQMLPE